VRAQQRYFDAEFDGDPCYRSRFVLMEFTRSYIRPIIGLCFDLCLPNIENTADTIIYWSNKFKRSELKAVPQMIGDILRTQTVDLTSAAGKEQSLRSLAAYIERVLMKMEFKFRDTGTDSARCARATTPLDVDLDQPCESLRRFVKAFDNVRALRGKCRIDDFVQRRYRGEVTRYLDKAGTLKSNRATTGFLGIADNLRPILDGGRTAGSCKSCEAIGDAIIALDAPRGMRLEHSDLSFDLLCDLIGQPHKRHPSASVLAKGDDGG
jgi:hypothetical protein